MKRREFLKRAAVTAAATGPFLGNVRGANDRVVVGQIGCGARGYYELTICQRNPNVRVAAVCDVYKPLVDGAVRLTEGQAEGYGDFRRILDRKDIDAVFVSTPDHWHAIPTILACQAGKDVYCEKPLTHTIEEGRRMVEAARKYKRVVQTGCQQRSAPHFAKTVELIRGGYIGKVALVEAWNVGNESPEGIGKPPDSPPPEGLDWDLYLGPAPKTPYNRNRFIWNYRWFWDYSGGMMTDWGAHHMDIVHWAMGVDAPLSAMAAGGIFCLQDNRETPDTLTTVFEYPGFQARYTNRMTSAFPLVRGYGMLFYGDRGALFVDRGNYEVYPDMRAEGARGDVDRIQELLRSGQPAAGPSPPRPQPKPLCEAIKETGFRLDPPVQEAHVQNFIDCVRSRRRPVADVEIGHRVVTACHLGVIAYRTGRKIRWDAKQERIVGDPEAQRMTSKQYRAPWVLPKV
jgi:predicted dehydrogenase